MQQSVKRFYFVDESGQDTGGQLFIVAVSVAVLIATFMKSKFASLRWIAPAIVVTIVAGFVPRAVHWTEQAEAKARHQTEGQATRARLLEEIESRNHDVETRITARNPYSPEEAIAFMDMLRRANLSWAGYQDQTPTVMPILQRALETKVLDPNLPVKSPRTAGELVPLFLYFHQTFIRRSPDDNSTIETRHWRIFQLIAAHGADLSTAGAERAAVDLRKTATPLYNGLYVRLD